MEKIVKNFKFPKCRVPFFYLLILKSAKAKSFDFNLLTTGNLYTMKKWRKVHIFAFGYWRWLSTLSALVIIIISATGILLEHKNDFSFMDRMRISTAWLPDSYQQRLIEIRKQQGTLGLYKDDSGSVPLSWVVYDLHAGIFFGEYAVYYYDFIAAALIVLSVTGIYMFFILNPKFKKRSTK